MFVVKFVLFVGESKFIVGNVTTWNLIITTPEPPFPPPPEPEPPPPPPVPLIPEFPTTVSLPFPPPPRPPNAGRVFQVTFNPPPPPPPPQKTLVPLIAFCVPFPPLPAKLNSACETALGSKSLPISPAPPPLLHFLLNFQNQ